MFMPVSLIEYRLLDPDQQLLVCTLSTETTAAHVAEKWATRAAAAFKFEEYDDISEVVRDVLANPQIRAVVFDGVGRGRAPFLAFWRREKQLEGINEEHLEMVRQFVDLFDDDCHFHKPKQPFWYKRLIYKTPET